MKPVPPSRQLVSLPLNLLVAELLGGQSDVPISPQVAEILLLVTKNKHTCYVQLPSDENVDLYGNPLQQPRLWAFNHWLSATERWQRQRVIAHQLAQQREIERYNHKLVTKAVLKMWPLPPDTAAMVAYAILKKGETLKLEVLGVKKLAVTIEDVK